MIVYHGSENPNITEFKTDSASFSLLGTGVYFYKNKMSAKNYGKSIYKVNIPSAMKIAPLGFKFSEEQAKEVMSKLGIPAESWESRPYGVISPLWWATDGWDFYQTGDRKKVIQVVSDLLINLGYDGITVNYPKGGEVVVVWKGYEKLKPQLMADKTASDDTTLAAELFRIISRL